MAEDAEKKDIAKLDFKIDDAMNKLDKIDEKLKSISDSSEAYAKKIGQNLGNAINSGMIIDNQNINKNLNQITTLSKANAERLSVQLQKIEAKKQAGIAVEAEKGEQARQTAAYKSALKQEEYNNRILKSTQTLYDKIVGYAKTYIIYQGFNQLKQGIKETIDEMVEVEYQMVQIDRVLNDSSLNIDKYRDKLIQLAYDYGNAFDNVADISLRLAQAGYDSNEVLALSEKTLLALNTAELDATQATEDMVAVMAQWGLMTGTATEQAETYGSIIDKINKVADNFPTTSEDILEALKKTSSAFNLAGASIDETIATIVAAETASQRGGKVIGTALSNIVQQLKAEGKLDLAEQLGLDFFTDANKTEFKPIMEIFEEMSTMMQNLKDQGKESSVEMQSLLEMFTVFRRNIGASLLGEMSGEDSTYLQVLETSLNSVGYSLQENEKHMQTAKAAQAQFNAELLKLKTNIWDEGLEEVFRDMLNMGTNLVDGISKIIDKFGALPTSIGVVTAALTTLKGGIKVQDIITLTGKVEDINAQIEKTGIALKNDDKLLEGTSKSFKDYVTSVDKGTISLKGYASNLVLSTVKTTLLTAATIALNAAITAGLSAAITFIVSKIDDWVHAEEKAIEKHKELKETAQENANEINDEIASIQELRKQYEELAKKEERTPEENQKIYELQEQLNQLIKDSGTQVELVTTKLNEQGEEVQAINDKYDEQIAKIKALEYEKKKAEVEELRKAAEEAQELVKGISGSEFQGGIWQKIMDTTPIDKVKSKINELGISVTELNEELATDKTFFGKPLVKSIEDLDFEGQLKYFRNAQKVLEKAKKEGKDVSEALEIVNNVLDTFDTQVKEATNAIDKYADSLSELYSMLGYANKLTSYLQAIADSYDIEGPKKLIEDIQNINQQFTDGTINIEQYFDLIQQKIAEIDLSAEGEELEAYQAIFAATTQSLVEGLESLISGLESNTINFTEYSKGIKEAADNMLELRKEQNNLILDEEGIWRDAGNNVDTYANTLQNAKDELNSFGDLLTVIGDNYDYISEHANEAGEAIFKQSDVGTQAYTNLANNVAISLQKMKTDNENAYNAIVDKVFESMGTTANEVANADTYITEALNGNAQALNAALNESAKQVAISTTNVTTSMGNVLSELGNAISNFNYKITAQPFITGFGDMGIKLDENGKLKIDLPTFGFNINGEGGDSIKGLGAALNQFGTDLTTYASNKFTYTKLKSQVGPYKPTTKSPSTTIPRTSSGSGTTAKDTSAEDAAKAEEEAYKARLSAFEDYISEKERLEKRWVDKQKELGQLSNEDYLYITQQRIERYKKYLQEVKNATWMNEEDKLKLIKEYSEKIEDLQVDYLGYLQDQLEDEIDALKKANEEKIKLIEDEADARIAALKKVEDETDRIREEEEYQKKRASILEEISYWEQRTGREAQEALKEAKENLKELDEEWKQQLEDWSIEDQIAAIEEERDAQVKAIEDAQAAEIESMQAIYDEKVKLFAETGQIIYNNSVIQSQALYNAYKTNFIDPVTNDLNNLNKAAVSATTSASTAPTTQQYETYLIKSGDTLSKIAKRYGTTVEKIMAANPYVTNKNKIYAGKTLQIPKFHEGGIVGGNQEAFALLKPREVILKPEWADGINKLAKMARSKENQITSNSTVIEVKGDLVRIDANIKNKTDAEYLTKKIEKTLKDKFNIKK